MYRRVIVMYSKVAQITELSDITSAFYHGGKARNRTPNKENTVKRESVRNWHMQNMQIHVFQIFN